MRQDARPYALLLALATGLAASSALAVDGVVEINQARATAGGVTLGDAPGFPVTLSSPGSYRLTGNLTVGSENVTAIQVSADGVSIDLNGFSILGPVVCTSSCSPAGTGVAIDAASSGRLSVTNGNVQRMGARGIVAGNDARIDRVRLKWNGGDGLQVGPGSAVVACVITQNGGYGIVGSPGPASVQLCRVKRNLTGGMVLGAYSTATNNTVCQNTGYGIGIGSGGVALGNGVWSNTGVGLSLGTGMLVDGYVENGLDANNGTTMMMPQPQVTGGTQLGANACRGTTTCP